MSSGPYTCPQCLQTRAAGSGFAGSGAAGAGFAGSLDFCAADLLTAGWDGAGLDGAGLGAGLGAAGLEPVPPSRNQKPRKNMATVAIPQTAVRKIPRGTELISEARPFMQRPVSIKKNSVINARMALTIFFKTPFFIVEALPFHRGMAIIKNARSGDEAGRYFKRLPSSPVANNLELDIVFYGGPLNPCKGAPIQAMLSSFSSFSLSSAMTARISFFFSSVWEAARTS